MTVATQGGGAAETTTPRPNTLTISVRFSTGTYVARAKGHKQTASCTENACRAAERLTEKLGMAPRTRPCWAWRAQEPFHTVKGIVKE